MADPKKIVHAILFRKLQKGRDMMLHRDEVPFLRALAAGALVGGAPWLIITLPLAVLGAMEGQILGGFLLILIPALVAGMIILPSMVVFGLPTTSVLAAEGRECPRIYALCGAIFGFLIPLVTLLAFEGDSFVWHRDLLFLALNGMLAGAVTAFVWGKHRKRLRDAARHEADDTPNPIHDLLF